MLTFSINKNSFCDDDSSSRNGNLQQLSESISFARGLQPGKIGVKVSIDLISEMFLITFDPCKDIHGFSAKDITSNYLIFMSQIFSPLESFLC